MAFLGMRGTGDWATNQRPENWRETILFLYPNGKVPLTAMLAMLNSESTNDPHYHWFTKTLPKQYLTATGIYTDSALSSAYSSGAVAGTTLYVKGSEAQVSEFRDGHTIILTKSGDQRYDTFASVTSRVLNGANSYLAVRLEEAASATYDLDEANFAFINGNANAEGATMPDGVSYDPVEYDNYTQIFRTPLSITRTAQKTKLRTGPAYQEMKREALELHAIEMEKAFLTSKKSLRTVGGQPRRTTQGLIPFAKQYAPAENISDFQYDSEFTGDTWVAGGEDWLDRNFEALFTYGNSEKMGLIGTGALRGLNKLAKTNGNIQLHTRQKDYGIQVIEWITPYGIVWLKTHPLLSYNPQYKNTLVTFDLDKIGYRFIDDTFFKEDKSDKENTNNSRDGKEEEFLTECGFEADHPETMGVLSGIGLENSL